MGGNPNLVEIEVLVEGVSRTAVAERLGEPGSPFEVTLDDTPIGQIVKDTEATVHTRRWVTYDLKERKTGFYPNLRFALYNMAIGNGRPRTTT